MLCIHLTTFYKRWSWDDDYISRVKRKSILNILFASILITILIYNPKSHGFRLSNYIIFTLGVFCLMFYKITSLKIKKADVFAFLLFYCFCFQFDFLWWGCVVGCSKIVNSTHSGFDLLIYEEPGQSGDDFSHYLLVANICACLTGIAHSYILKAVTCMMNYNDVWITRMTGAFVQPNVLRFFSSWQYL